MRTFGENARRIREGKKIERRDMAKMLGLAEGSSAVADLESDRNDPKLSKVLRVAKSLKVSVEDLLDHVDAEYEPFRRVPPRHTGTGEQPVPSKAGAHAATADTRVLQDRITALENELAAANGLIRQFRKLADGIALGETARPKKARPRGV